MYKIYPSWSLRFARMSILICLFALLFLLTACGSDNIAQSAQESKSTKPGTVTKTPSPTTVISTPTPTATPTPQSALPPPARIILPSINIDAPVEPVGTTADGNLETPQQNPWDGTGWFSSGTRPGDTGSAVIDGHLDRPGGAPAVFWNLKLMKPGDAVKVIDEQGKMLTFSVTRVEYYHPTEAPIEDIFGNRTGKFLNLITCAGTWIPSEKQTTLRFVVYTTLVS